MVFYKEGRKGKAPGFSLGNIFLYYFVFKWPTQLVLFFSILIFFLNMKETRNVDNEDLIC